MTFDDIWPLTSTISSETAYTKKECHALFTVANQLPRGSLVLEVGCEAGRSTSVLAQVAVDRDLTLFLIDPFVTNVEHKPWLSLMEMLCTVGAPFVLFGMRSIDVHMLPTIFSMIHIDGDHDKAGLEDDCKLFLPRVEIGGYALFHDYTNDGLPDVFPTVNKYTLNDHWVSETYGSLRVCRRAD